MARFTRFLSGFTLGAVIGAVSVLLFTPNSGEEFRENISKYYQDSINQISEASEQKRKELESQLESLRKPAPIAE